MEKINLKALFDEGKITYTAFTPGEVGNESQGVKSLFDGKSTLNDDRVLLQGSQAPTNPSSRIQLQFDPKITGQEFLIETSYSASSHLSYSINGSTIQSGIISASSHLSSDITSSANKGSFSFKTSTGLDDVIVAFATQSSTQAYNDVNIFEIELFKKNDNFEFNDTVLETKAWNSSRYDGRQLSGSGVNIYEEGDITYANTPVIQNVSTNIYLGSRVIGMETGSIEDTSLVNFSGFSYVTVHDFITVNDDLSVTRHSVRGDTRGATKNKKGFYQSWYDDFPVGSTAELKMMDPKLQQSLRPSYTIFNNSGQLQKLLLVTQHPGINTNPLDEFTNLFSSGSNYTAAYTTSSNQFSFSTASNASSIRDLGASFFIYNQELLIDEFFSGSLIATPPPYVDGGIQPEALDEDK